MSNDPNIDATKLPPAQETFMHAAPLPTAWVDVVSGGAVNAQRGRGQRAQAGGAVMTQFAMAAFGLAALWMALSVDPVLVHWAPVVGLLGQPAWAWFAWRTRAWGLSLTVAADTCVYRHGVYVQIWSAA